MSEDRNEKFNALKGEFRAVKKFLNTLTWLDDVVQLFEEDEIEVEINVIQDGFPTNIPNSYVGCFEDMSGEPFIPDDFIYFLKAERENTIKEVKQTLQNMINLLDEIE